MPSPAELVLPVDHKKAVRPVVLGGDIGSYALGRQFHEAYGVKSVCAASAPIAALRRSCIFEHRPVERLSGERILRAVREEAAAHPNNVLVVVTNLEPAVVELARLRDRLPSGVVTPVPSLAQVEGLARKDRFARLCDELGLPTPATEVVGLGGDSRPAKSKLPFPVVAKPSFSPEYAACVAQGFRKVYLVESQERLDALWEDLRRAGFAGTFLVQELVYGGDDCNMSVTAYISRSGRATLLSAAQTLLNDHAPSMLGNAVAMLTRPMERECEQTRLLLERSGYTGFACVDLKRDARTGRTLFFEANPRPGRNSYYVCAAGENPMRHMVEDLVFGRELPLSTGEREALYTLVPLTLLRRYLTDPELRCEVERAVHEGRVADPQRYAPDRGLVRMLDVAATELNQYRKFRRYYPRPTKTSF